MTYVVFWFLFSIAVGVLASNKGRSGFGWFLLSMLISPLLGMVFCAVSKNLATEKALKAISDAAPGPDTHVKCPACAEWVLPAASVCKHCGHDLTPDVTFEKKRLDRWRLEEESKHQMLTIGAIAGFIAILAVFSLIMS